MKTKIAAAITTSTQTVKDRCKMTILTAYVCSDCGSDDIFVDAYAQWNPTGGPLGTGCWELVNEFPGDNDACQSCEAGSDATGEQIPLSELVTKEE